MLVNRMSSVADGPKPVESWNAEAACKVAVRPTTDRDFVQRKTQAFSDQFGQRE